MARTKKGLVKLPPPDAVEILTRDPTRPGDTVSAISTGLLTLAGFGFLFITAVIVVWPFLLLWHRTPYPNLATVAFTAYAGAAALVLFSAYLAARFAFRWAVARFRLGDLVLRIWLILLKVLDIIAWVLFSLAAAWALSTFLYFLILEAI